MPLSSSVSALFAGGPAAELVTGPAGSTAPHPGVICLNGSQGENPEKLPSAGKVVPFFFGTDTTVGLKVAWSGMTSAIPDSLRFGFNRKEFALAPVFTGAAGCAAGQRGISIPHLQFSPADEMHWLALAQHHGVPTRLLDWSENPLVAAYFAVMGYDDGKRHGAIYVTPRPQTHTGPQDEPFAIREVQFFTPAHVSARITAQRGVFTLHPNPNAPYHPKRTEQLVIDGALRMEFLERLGTFGIDHGSIFPDIQGLAQRLTWRYGEARRAWLIGAAQSLPIDADDPQKGQWGGKPVRNGWCLSARINGEEEGWYNVHVTVESVKGGQKLTKPVTIHLHDTFPNPVYDLVPRAGRATDSFWCYGAFTVGVRVRQDDTALELDLKGIKGAPEAFRSN